METDYRAGESVRWNFKDKRTAKFARSFDHNERTTIEIDHVVRDESGKTTICYFRYPQLNIMIGISVDHFIKVE